MSLQGAIEELGLCELIQALALNRYRGTLRIEPEGGASKFFYLNEGEIVLLRTVDSEPVRIGELLVRAGLVDQPQIDQALQAQKSTSYRRLGETLVALGLVQRQDLDGVVHQRFEEEFLDIFLLDRGQFEFIFGLTPEALFPANQMVERIALNTSSLMLEAMRRVDDWHALLKELGSLDEIYEKKPAPPLDAGDAALSKLTATQRRTALDVVDGQRSLRDILAIVQDSGASRLAGLHYVKALRAKGLVAPLDEHAYLERLAHALVSDDVDATAKLIRCLIAKGPIELALVERYIEFVRQSGRPSFARHECKLLGAHYLVRGEVEHAIDLYGRALELDPRDTEVLDRLFYAHLRRSDVSSALGLATPLREAMTRDRDLPTVARIVKNMKELAPYDARVLELSGLLAKRQERLDDARAELESALAAAARDGLDEARRAPIRQALAEVTGEAPLRRSSEAPVPVLAGIARPRKKRRPWVALAVIGFALAAVEEGRLREERARHEPRVAAAVSSPAPPPAPAAVATRSAPPAITDADLADYEAARRRTNWALAARLARRIQDANDPRAERVRMPLRVLTTPAGASLALGDQHVTSPCILEAPVDSTVVIRIKAPGYEPREVPVRADDFHELSVELTRGPAWRHALRAPLVGLAAVGDAVVVATRPAKLEALALEDGAPRWERSLDVSDLGAPAFVQGSLVVPHAGGLVVLGDAGEEKARIATKRALFAPQEARSLTMERCLVAASDGLLLIDVARGAPTREIPLAAPPIAPPAVRANRAWALLADGTVVAANLDEARLLWTADPHVQAAGGPVHSPASALALAARDGSLLALSLSNGATSGRHAAGLGPLLLGPVADEEHILLASRERLVALDARTGERAWALDEPVESAPLVRGRRLYVPLLSRELAEVDAATGSVAARYPLDGATSALVPAGKVLLVASGSSVQAIAPE